MTKFGKQREQRLRWGKCGTSHPKFIKISKFFVFLSSANAELHSLHYTVTNVRGDSSQSSPYSSFVLPNLTRFLYFACFLLFLKFPSKTQSLILREKLFWPFQSVNHSERQCSVLNGPHCSTKIHSLFR